MEPEDLDSFSSNMNPVDAVSRLDGKRKVGKKEKHELEPLDIAAMRMNAWNIQRQAQKERKKRGSNIQALLEDLTAAADVELASMGFPFNLQIEIEGGGFTWVLLHTDGPLAGEISARSDRIEFAEIARQTLGGRLKDFLIENLS